MKPPLTRDRLRLIQDRNLKYADAMTLLREIKRLQGIVVETAALLPAWGQQDEETVECVERLMETFETEPCVAEDTYDRLKQGRDEIAQKRNGQPRSPNYRIR